MRWAWTTLWQGVYQPLGWMLAEAEYCVLGLAPSGYHLVSLILNAVNAILFYVLIQTLISRTMPEAEPGRRWVIPVMSGLAAALFAVHPLRAEVVAWASCQPYLPCVGFAILSVLAYLRGCGEGQRHLGWLAASIGFYAAALGCKAAAIGLPLVLLILDVAVLRRLGAGRSTPGVWIEKFPYLVLAIAAAYFAVKAKTIPGRLLDPSTGGAPIAVQRVASAGYGLAYYPWKTVWPAGLSAYHYRPFPIEPAEPRFLWSLVAVAAVAALALALRRRHPAIPAALLSYAALLAPNVGLVSSDLMLVADRYSYLATMPLFVLAAGGLARGVVGSRWPRLVALGIVAMGLGLVVAWSAMSRVQCRTWRDSETLVAHGLKVGSGRDALLVSNYGLDLIASRRFAAGMAQLRKAIAIDPADADARENLGVTLFQRGDLAGAIVQLGEAVRLAPGRFEFRYLLGVALARSGRLDDAAEQLATAVQLRPDRAQLHVALGDVLAALRRRKEAATQFTEALRLDPEHPGAHRGLAELERD